MAYSPLEEGLLSHKEHPALREVAKRHDASSAQVALAWTIRSGGVIAIPKTSHESRVRENAVAASIRLTKRDLETLDGSFAGPDEAIPLETR
jgi:diketogulonate reductase-like aldo/keto reductase